MAGRRAFRPESGLALCADGQGPDGLGLCRGGNCPRAQLPCDAIAWQVARAAQHSRMARLYAR